MQVCAHRQRAINDDRQHSTTPLYPTHPHTPHSPSHPSLNRRRCRGALATDPQLRMGLWVLSRPLRINQTSQVILSSAPITSNHADPQTTGLRIQMRGTECEHKPESAKRRPGPAARLMLS
ncbi:hypothetical protein E1301_Tti010655 [Triplophysa tibetana]|uniref:Uncharacterized protein n=1 Tax=Triplophysa tibetana TaxID=1572043 RepID=A0A5A9PW56_9TELE|nr:hypothetical protein E1301_Tti010655 [Triplophysa tibetana]